MANLELNDKHNMVAYLEKFEGSEGFHNIIDFLNQSHIKYALTKNPTIYVSFIKQFWRTATANTRTDEKVDITATVDGYVKTITEASLRRHLKLEDNEGETSLPNSEIFEQLALMGYVTYSDKLTFQEGNFSPQWSIALTKLILRVKKLEKQVKSGKARRRARIVLSEDKDIADDSSKQGRKISDIDANPTISLMQDEEMTWFQEDLEVQEKQSHDTKVLIEKGEPTEIVEHQGSAEKGEREVSTVGIPISTADVTISTATETPGVSTAQRIMYSRRIAVKRKDKGKAILTEPEPEKKTKKQLELERLRHEEAVRLQEQLDEEERAKIARDAEIGRQLQEEINLAGLEKVVAQDDQNQVIDWNDPSVIRYHALKLRPRSVAKDFNHAFVPKDSDIEKEVMQRSGFDLQQESKKAEESLKRKTSEERMDVTKKQKTYKDDQKEEDIIKYMEIVPVEEIAIVAIPLASKPPMIVDVEIISEGKVSSYHIIRADGSSKRYTTLTLLLQDIDREDLEIL
ncbi:hypothetical protein Tco_0285829 [Tanacetum coccineum]